jgi:hypothetical protein
MTDPVVLDPGASAGMRAPTVTERTDHIKQLGLDSGAVVVGVADVAAFNEFVPEGHRPTTSCRGRGAWWSPGAAGRPPVPGAAPTTG